MEQLDRGMVNWLYYNFSAEVFTERNFVADFIRLKLHFIKKTKKIVFRATFGRLRGNVRIPSIARWKARDRLPIRHI